jgi:superfamily I DNA and/or RNA helicase
LLLPPAFILLCRRWERRDVYTRLDELQVLIKKATDAIVRRLLDSADVVGVTCTGAAGPELQHFAFDMVVIDEGSQASE